MIQLSHLNTCAGMIETFFLKKHAGLLLKHFINVGKPADIQLRFVRWMAFSKLCKRRCSQISKMSVTIVLPLKIDKDLNSYIFTDFTDFFSKAFQVLSLQRQDFTMEQI